MTLKPAVLVVPLLLAALAQGCTKSPSSSTSTTDTMTTSGAMPGSTSGTKAGMPVGPSAQLAVPRSGG